MKISPVLVVGGLVAVGAAVMLGSSKAKAQDAAPLPIGPDVPPIGPGGAVAVDCPAALQWMLSMRTVIAQAGDDCHKTNNPQSCSNYNMFMAKMAQASDAYVKQCGPLPTV